MKSTPLEALFELGGLLALVVDRSNQLSSISPALAALAEELHPSSADGDWLQLLPPDERGAASYQLEVARRTGLGRPITIHLRARSEQRIPCDVSFAAARGGAVVGLLRRLDGHPHEGLAAHFDALTLLPNRRRFLELLERRLRRWRNGDSPRFAVVYLDLDHFKRVNDSCGHFAGDELLREVAQRLEASLRPGDVVGRLGGDEFSVLIDHIDRQSDALSLAERIERELARPFVLGERRLTVTASIGIATSRRRVISPENLLRESDAAMYRAKRLGRARHVVYDADMRRDDRQRDRLARQLRGALSRNELEVHYQPRIDLDRWELAGMEALLRWRHDRQGLLLPTAFLELAVDLGLLVEMERWLLQKACEQLVQWRLEGLVPVPLVSVNLCAASFLHCDLATFVEQVLDSTGLTPADLQAEITETALDRDPLIGRRNATDLKRLGVSLYLDDFASGRSSLTRLLELPFAGVKIDHRLIRDLERQRQRSLAAAVLRLSEELDLVVVAEGVEQPEQLDLLQAMRCRYVEGPLFGAPGPGAGALQRFSQCLAAVRARPTPAQPGGPATPGTSPRLEA